MRILYHLPRCLGVLCLVMSPAKSFALSEEELPLGPGLTAAVGVEFGYTFTRGAFIGVFASVGEMKDYNDLPVISYYGGELNFRRYKSQQFSCATANVGFVVAFGIGGGWCVGDSNGFIGRSWIGFPALNVSHDSIMDRKHDQEWKTVGMRFPVMYTNLKSD